MCRLALLAAVLLVGFDSLADADARLNSADLAAVDVGCDEPGGFGMGPGGRDGIGMGGGGRDGNGTLGSGNYAGCDERSVMGTGA